MKDIIYDTDFFKMKNFFVQDDREPESFMELYVLEKDRDIVEKVIDDATEEYWQDHNIAGKDAHYCTYLQCIKRRLENKDIPYIAKVNDTNPLKDRYDLAEWNGDTCY